MARASSQQRSNSPVKVLFIGNSFTARNDLPGMVTALAAAAGVAVKTRLLSMGGASLRSHWNKGEAQGVIRAGRYDFVVLQEQSTLPVKNAARMHENIRLFDETIREAGAQTVLYLTWARRNTPEHQALITEAYTSIGREIGAIVAPVGIAWQRLLQGHDHPVLHDRDSSHPTVAGTYLAACVFAVALFGLSQPASNVSIAGLTDSDVKLLQGVALEKRTTSKERR